MATETTETMSGRCLCGAVRFTVKKVTEVDVCHCTTCCRLNAGPAFNIHGHDLAFEDESAIGLYPSSDFAERGFCARCGTNLFYRLLDGGFTAVNAFTLAGHESLDFTLQVFTDEQVPFYAFANDTKRMTGAEVVAAFSGASGASEREDQP